jgi:uncharacterized protein with PIN domain
MAKKKLTARQVKARKKKQYVRYEYNLTIDALDYLNEFGADIKFKLTTNPTAASLKAIRNVYNKATKKLKERHWVLPTKRQMAKQVREEQPYRKSRAKRKTEQAPVTFQPETDYIEDLIQSVSNLTGAERTKTTQRTEDYNKARLQEAKNRLFDKLSYARTKAGDTELAEALAADDFIQHVDEMNVRYDYEIVDGIDDTLIPMLESAMYNVLDSM